MPDRPPSSTDPAPSAPSGPGDSSERRAARGYRRAVLALMAIALAAVSAQDLHHPATRASWLFLAGGAGAGLLSMAAWGILVRRQPRAPGLVGWLAAPAAMFGAAAMVPLLVLAAIPQTRDRLKPADRIALRERDGRIEIVFPRPVLAFHRRAGGEPADALAINLRLDATPASPDLFAAHPELAAWLDLRVRDDRRVLRLDLEGICRVLGIPRPRRLGLNAIFEARQLHYASGERIPQQWLSLAAP
jgi:hypothetical protein